MKQSRALNGNLEENRTYVNYVGVDTDSVSMHVDNGKNTISADVKWKNVVGTEKGKAYPAELGNQLSTDVINLTKRLEAEIQRAKSIEDKISIDALNSLTMVNILNEELNQKIKELSKETQSDIAKIHKEIINECSRATNTEKELLQMIQSIIDSNDQSDVNLEETVNQIKSLLNKTETELTELVYSEIDRAVKEEKELKSLIIEELKRAVLSENELQDLIISVKYTLEKKISQVSVKLANETESRISEDDKLRTKINSEIDRATQSEDEIISKLTSLEEDTKVCVNSLENEDKRLNSRIDDSIEEIAITNNLIKQEVIRATSAESLLDNKITETNELINESVSEINQEINSLTTDIEKSNESIDINSAAITKERNRAISAEDGLKIDISNLNKYSEANRRLIDELTDNTEDSIEILSLNIENLENCDIHIINELTRQAEEISNTKSDFSTRLDEIESELSDTFVEKIKIDPEDESIKIYAETNKGAAVLNTSSVSYEPNTVVMRDTVGNIHVPTATSYDDDCLVPSYYIDYVMKDLLNQVENKMDEIKQIKFIDGGNAPI